MRYITPSNRLKPHISRIKTIQVWRLAIVIVLFAAGAIISLRGLQAASNTTDKEIESVQPVGNASIVDDATASGNKAVRFGFGKPTNLVARTGGNNIALLWDLPFITTGSVEVFRNGTRIGTVTPGNGVVRGDTLGTRYIDRAVTRGTTYQYQVRSVSPSGQSTELTAAISAVHPNNSTPVPTITIDASQATDLTDYLNNYAKPEIETWYPKIANAIAFPDYTPRSQIRLVMDPTITVVANASYTTGVINVNPVWLRANLEDGGGMFVHELTHILQAYPGPDKPFWASEGIADWTRDYFTRERYQKHVPKPTAKLDNGYSEGAYMIQWAEVKYSPGFIRKLNIALHNGTYTNSLVPSLTNGRTPEQLYTEAQNAHKGPTGSARLAGSCLDVKDSSTANDADLRILTCATASPAQKWSLSYIDAGLNGTTRNKFTLVNYDLAPSGRCVYASDTSNRAFSSICGPGDDQRDKWSKAANNSLVNIATSKCLATATNNPTSGNLLTAVPCDGSIAQSWILP